MEKLTESCFVCNQKIVDNGISLCNETTLYSKTGFPTKLMQLLGEAFMLVILEDDKICLRCVELINLTDRLEHDLSEIKKIIMEFLNNKYDLNGSEDHLLTTQEFADKKFDCVVEEENCAHSPSSNVKSPFNEKQNFCDSLENNEELYEKSSSKSLKKNISGTRETKKVKKLRPILPKVSSWQELSLLLECTKNKVLGSELQNHTVNIMPDKETKRKNSSFKLGKPSYHKRDEAETVKKLQPILPKTSNIEEVLPSLYIIQNANSSYLVSDEILNNLPTNNLFLKSETHEELKINNDSPLSNNKEANHPSAISETSEKSDNVLKNSHSHCLENFLLSETSHEDKSPKSASSKLSELELQNHPIDTILGKEIKKKTSFSEEQCDQKCMEADTVKKLQPMLPKGSNVEEILPSLYIIQNANSSYLVNNEILNNLSKYNLFKNCETSDIAKTNDKPSLNEKEATEDDLNTDNKISRKVPSDSGDKDREDPNMRYQCQFCPKSYKNKSTLTMHGVLHTGDYSVFCEFCGKGFANNAKLNDHRKSHTKEKRYICDKCGKGFHYHGSMWIHRKWHDNPFPYKCEECGRVFKHSSLLSVHRRKHKGERPYKCSYCNLTFSVSSSLNSHLMLHTKQFPFKCNMCNRQFTRRYRYSDHLARKHNIFIEKPNVDPKDYKMVICENASKRTVKKSSCTEETVTLSEGNVEILENSEPTFYNPDDCHIEIILPPSSVIGDENLSNIDWVM